MNIDVRYLSSSSWDAEMPARLKWLRENDPVHWSELDQLWVISKYADVSYVSKNQQLFTSGKGVRPDNPTKLGLIDEAEPRHTQLRRLINKGFSPRMVAKLEEAFRGIVTNEIDAIAERGECDFVASISVPLPLLLIAEMIGIRKEDRERFHHWSDSMIAADGNSDNPGIVESAGKAFVEYSEYVKEVIAERRRRPQDDLISVLIGADDDGILKEMGLEKIPAGAAVSDDHLDLINSELIMLLVVLMVAGNETTRNGISGGMQLLIENPDERRKLLDNPLLVPGGIEEMLRMTSPVQSFGRTVTEDTVLGGKSLTKGQTVLVVYPSANRDAEVYEDPDTFKVERNPEHLAFGIGNHFCLGANLARMEMRITFEELLRRLPDMTYSDGGPEFVPSAFVRTCARMRVRYTPETAGRRASG